MEPAAPAPTGYLHSLRSLGDDLLSIVQHRVELFAVELEEQKLRLIQSFIWISAAISAGMLAMTFASLTLVYLFWESARLAVLGGLTALYTLVLVGVVITYRRYLARQPDPFAGTLHELREDRACMQKES